jgi:hypothetical protein
MILLQAVILSSTDARVNVSWLLDYLMTLFNCLGLTASRPNSVLVLVLVLASNTRNMIIVISRPEGSCRRLFQDTVCLERMSSRKSLVSQPEIATRGLERGHGSWGGRRHPTTYNTETSCEAHPASCPMRTGGPFPGAKRGRGVTLTIYPHLMPRSVHC